MTDKKIDYEVCPACEGDGIVREFSGSWADPCPVCTAGIPQLRAKPTGKACTNQCEWQCTCGDNDHGR